jgi:hypothetical protein
MKMLFLSVTCFLLTAGATAQLKVSPTCPEFRVDLLDGSVSGVKADFINARIKALLPCFTSSTGEGDTARCGQTVFYKDRDIYFYTDRNYVEIGPKFKGKLVQPLMGAQRNSLFNLLGHPELKDVTWDAYKTTYGTLLLNFDSTNKVNQIRFSTESTATLRLCE